MAKRKCQLCGDPLGSTRERCHSCGGESFRGDRGGRNPDYDRGAVEIDDGLWLPYWAYMVPAAMNRITPLSDEELQDWREQRREREPLEHI